MPYSNKFTQSESELKGGNDRRRTSFDDILTLTCICCAKFICQIYELWYLYRWGCNGISYVQWKCVSAFECTVCSISFAIIKNIVYVV